MPRIIDKAEYRQSGGGDKVRLHLVGHEEKKEKEEEEEADDDCYEAARAMDAERILESLPRFNRLQAIVLGFLSFLVFRGPWQLFGIPFLFDVPLNVTCKLPSNITERYNATRCEYLDLVKNETSQCSEWDFLDMPEKKNSAIVEWNLVCDLEYLVSLDYTLFVAGQMIGALFLGSISDRIGRKPTIIVGLAIHVAISIILMFSVSVYMFIPFHFIAGAINQMIITAAYVLLSEWFTTKWRTVTTTGVMAIWAMGIVVLPWIAYGVRNWRGLILFYSIIPSVLCTILIPFFLPESFFFLVANGRYAQVEQILKRVKWPKPADNASSQGGGQSLGNSTMEMVSRASCVDREYLDKIQQEANSSWRKAILDILRSPRMLTYSITLFWLSVSLNFIYFVTSVMTGTLSGDKYVNWSLSGTVEVPFVIVTVIISAFVPRTVLIFVLYLVAFVSLVIFSQTGISAIAFFGRGASSAIYIFQLLYATEMFPTIVRNAGFGFFQFGENLGPVIGSAVTGLPAVANDPNSLYFALGIVSIINAAIISCMVETRGYVLPETVQDIASRQSFAVWHYLTCTFKRNAPPKPDTEKPNEKAVEKSSPDEGYF